MREFKVGDYVSFDYEGLKVEKAKILATNEAHNTVLTAFNKCDIIHGSSGWFLEEEVKDPDALKKYKYGWHVRVDRLKLCKVKESIE